MVQYHDAMVQYLSTVLYCTSRKGSYVPRRYGSVPDAAAEALTPAWNVRAWNENDCN